LIDLGFIPPSTFLPPSRLYKLLSQSLAYQRHLCLYHVRDPKAGLSLLSDHLCLRSAFPSLNSQVLREHEDEVWVVRFSNDGRKLASGGKDKKVILWELEDGMSMGFGLTSKKRNEFKMSKKLLGFEYEIGVLSWSPDDSLILAAGEHVIGMWNVSDGKFLNKKEDKHTYHVTAICWLPGMEGFISAGMDMKILFWVRI
jgi:WD repeat-containing protein 26